MTTALSQNGAVTLPEEIRKQLHLLPGDDFEVEIEDETTITLRRISGAPNLGLIDHILSCPGPLPPLVRDRGETAPLEL